MPACHKSSRSLALMLSRGRSTRPGCCCCSAAVGSVVSHEETANPIPTSRSSLIAWLLFSCVALKSSSSRRRKLKKSMLMSKARKSKSLVAFLLLIFSLSLSPLLAAAMDSNPLQRSTGLQAEESDEFEGGFSSLHGMLQWAISHSDPMKLKEKARDVKGSPTDEIVKIQLKMNEALEKLKMPSDTELMQAAIADLNNSSISFEDRYHALHNVLNLVESLSNANDLSRLGGLAAVIQELSSTSSEIWTISAWILGKASQNNPVVQKQIAELGALPILMKMVKSNFREEAIKSLHAISAVISNNPPNQDLFYSEAGELMLLDLLNDLSTSVRLLRKSASLIADLAQFKVQNHKEEKFPAIKINLMKSLANVVTLSTDFDLQEKALLGINNLVKLLISSKVLEPSVCSELDEALLKMGERLKNLKGDEYQRDYASEIGSLIESIRGELKVPLSGGF